MADARGAPARVELPAQPKTDAQRDAEFTSFYRDTIVGLAAYLVGHGAGPSEAGEVAQETMIMAHSRWARIHSPAAWCHQVALHAWWRRMGRAREVPAGLPVDRTSLWTVEDPFDPADDVVERHAVSAFMRSLPPGQRDVAALRMAGLGVREIAAELDVSRNAVRQRMCRARKAFDRRRAEEGDR